MPSIFLEYSELLNKESELGMVVVVVVVVTGISQLLFSLLVDCIQHENQKEKPSSIPLRALGMNTSPVCCQPRQARLVELVPWEHLPLCDVVSRAHVVHWTPSQSDFQCCLPAI